LTSTDTPSEEDQNQPDGPTRFCRFCLNGLNPDDVDTYHEVKSWVSGPKLDGPKLREQTGNYAHKSCIDLLVAGQAPDQDRLFDTVEEAVSDETPDEEPYDPSKNYDF
jgi:hypothetical protein